MEKSCALTVLFEIGDPVWTCVDLSLCNVL